MGNRSWRRRRLKKRELPRWTLQLPHPFPRASRVRMSTANPISDSGNLQMSHRQSTPQPQNTDFLMKIRLRNLFAVSYRIYATNKSKIMHDSLLVMAYRREKNQTGKIWSNGNYHPKSKIHDTDFTLLYWNASPSPDDYLTGFQHPRCRKEMTYFHWDHQRGGTVLGVFT